MDLAGGDQRLVRDFLADLAAHPSAHGLPALMSRLRALLASDATLFYGYRLSGEGIALDFAYGDGFRPPMGLVASCVADIVRASNGERWGLFDPLRPGPSQRNRSKRIAWPKLPPATEAAFRGMGVDGLGQLRALIFERGEMLGWVGGFIEGVPSVRQAALLQAVVPALRSLLWTEARLREVNVTRGALAAAMEAIGAAAFIVSANAHLVHVNSVGRAELARDGHAVRAMLQQAVRHSTPEATVTPLVVAGAAMHFLVVRRSPPGDVRLLVTGARERYGLTWREVDVLERLVQGASNRAIAAALRCAERTIEVHLTHLLAKVGVESRAALVARFWMDARRA